MSSSKYVICIDDSMSSGITKGNVYKYLGKGNQYFIPSYEIVNDYGIIDYYYEDRFKPVRDNNINKLLYKGL